MSIRACVCVFTEGTNVSVSIPTVTSPSTRCDILLSGCSSLDPLTGVIKSGDKRKTLKGRTWSLTISPTREIRQNTDIRAYLCASVCC